MKFNELKQMYAAKPDVPIEAVAPRRIVLNRGAGVGVAKVDYGKREPNYMTYKLAELERAAKDYEVK